MKRAVFVAVAGAFALSLFGATTQSAGLEDDDALTAPKLADDEPVAPLSPGDGRGYTPIPVTKAIDRRIHVGVELRGEFMFNRAFVEQVGREGNTYTSLSSFNFNPQIAVTARWRTLFSAVGITVHPVYILPLFPGGTGWSPARTDIRHISGDAYAMLCEKTNTGVFIEGGVRMSNSAVLVVGVSRSPYTLQLVNGTITDPAKALFVESGDRLDIAQTTLIMPYASIRADGPSGRTFWALTATWAKSPLNNSSIIESRAALLVPEQRKIGASVMVGIRLF